MGIVSSVALVLRVEMRLGTYMKLLQDQIRKHTLISLAFNVYNLKQMLTD